jgi:hypothetical protein
MHWSLRKLLQPVRLPIDYWNQIGKQLLVEEMQHTNHNKPEDLPVVHMPLIGELKQGQQLALR